MPGQLTLQLEPGELTVTYRYGQARLAHTSASFGAVECLKVLHHR